jgi:hypothetical protein
VTPEAVVDPEKLLVQEAFQKASEMRILPEAAPVVRRNQLKLPVPTTSRLYQGIAVPIPTNVPV